MERINDTEEAWDNGELGRDPKYAERLPAEEWDKERSALDDALGLKAISIRLEKELIEDFKMIATLNGMGYQPLMRQALRRFADCEKKRILNEAYQTKVESDQLQALGAPPEPRKAA
jgi:uncharacterized protein (DUF4415 family)